MGNVGLTVSRHGTELFYILEFSDRWLEAVRYFKNIHDRVPCLGLSWMEGLSKDGYHSETWGEEYCFVIMLINELNCGEGEEVGSGSYRALLRRLSAPWALSFESLLCIWYSGFQKATHEICDRVVNQSTALWLKIHLVTLSPLIGIFLFFPLCLKKLLFLFFLRKNSFKSYKGQLRCISLFLYNVKARSFKSCLRALATL